MELDHVLIAVTDLDAAARDFESRHGLASNDGGRHRDFGTANRIIPLGSTYLELVAVVDSAAATASSFGWWVDRGATDEGRLIGWAVRTSALDEVAGRLELPIRSGSRVTPSGSELRWRSAGIDEAIAEPCLPFFIEWDEGVPYPGSVAAPRASIARVVLGGSVDRVAAWLGEHTLPIRVIDGPAEVAAVVLTTAAGEIIL
ncbi:MAG TPA: VOC family protein [Candidatus Limnocylindrales bacterium]|nr:VOC family protein [Candidatus Limnocylindrales bacterium]